LFYKPLEKKQFVLNKTPEKKKSLLVGLAKKEKTSSTAAGWCRPPRDEQGKRQRDGTEEL